MELRLLKSEKERDQFRANMLEARASRGAKFRETATSRLSEIQLAFGRLYGLINESNPDCLLGGFSIHCLNEFSQSFPMPNLSHLAPSSVYEAGQLWTSSHEAMPLLRKGSFILLGLLQAQAFLIYPLIIPRDVSTLYRVFKRVSPPFELPFAETVKGEKVYMQAMLLEGDDLREQIQLASRDGFQTRDGHSVIRFNGQNISANRLSHTARWPHVIRTDGANGTTPVAGANHSGQYTAMLAHPIQTVKSEPASLPIGQPK